MNNWNFTGHLGKDAEQRFTQNGDSVVTFSVAVASGYGDRQHTTWPRCQLWGKRGDSLLPYLNKGQSVGVCGEVTLREWDDNNGVKRQALEVRVSDLTLLGKRDGNGAQQPQGQQRNNYAEAMGRGQQQRQAPPPSSGNLADMDDDIPFAPMFSRNAYCI